MVPNPQRKRFVAWYERLTLLRAVRTILTIAVSLGVIAAILARILEPETFTSIGLAFWWAVTTITTVGYGDVVPHTTAGRLVGTTLMLTGLSLIPTITSVAVSIVISKRSREQMEQDARDRAEHAERLVRIEQALAQLQGSSRD